MYRLYEYRIFRVYHKKTRFFQRVLKGHLRETYIISSKSKQITIFLNRRFDRIKFQRYGLSFERKIQLGI